jgi:hypothetical protein
MHYPVKCVSRIVFLENAPVALYKYDPFCSCASTVCAVRRQDILTGRVCTILVVLGSGFFVGKVRGTRLLSASEDIGYSQLTFQAQTSTKITKMIAKMVDGMVISSELGRMKEATALVEEADALINEESSDETALSKEAQSLYLQALTIQESFVGWCHEETARTYHQMGWLAYNGQNYPRALGYLLQSLRISHRLYGEDHPSTILLLDDIQDLLEDMKLETEYGNRIFESWALQDEAEDLMEEDDNHCEDAIKLHRQALELLPTEVELERAQIYCQIASLLGRERHIEQAVSYYCQALKIFPKWLSPSSHPRILATRKQAHEVAPAKLTPIGDTASPLSRCSSCRTELSYSRQVFSLAA